MGNPKNKKAAIESQKNRKFKIITCIVVIVVALSAALVLFIKSSAFNKNTTALMVDNMEFSIADYNYYYMQGYMSYYNYFGDDMAEYVEDSYIKESVDENIATLVALYNAAIEDNVTLEAEDYEEIDAQIAKYQTQANANNISLEKYLVNNFGKGVDEALVRERLEMDTLANKYADIVKESYEYDSDKLEDEYDPNEDDKIDFYLFTLSIDTESDDVKKDFDVKATAANAFADEVTTAESFAELAYEYATDSNKAIYLTSPESLMKHYSAGALNETYKDWLLAPERKEGDVTVKASDTAIYVLYFVNRDRNDYNTLTVHSIFVGIGDISYSSYDSLDEYKDAYDKKLAEAKESAETAYNEWLSGDKSVEEFDKLAKAYGYAEGTGSYSLDDYAVDENVVKYFYSSKEADEWLFDPDRQEGDTKIIGTSTGYYILYFDKVNDTTYKQTIVERELREADFEEWLEASTADIVPIRTWAFRFAV